MRLDSKSARVHGLPGHGDAAFSNMLAILPVLFVRGPLLTLRLLSWLFVVTADFSSLAAWISALVFYEHYLLAYLWWYNGRPETIRRH